MHCVEKGEEEMVSVVLSLCRQVNRCLKVCKIHLEHSEYSRVL